MFSLVLIGVQIALFSAAGRASEREGGKERGEMEEKGRGGDLSSDAKTSLI
jgi:hypothetical protein